MNVTSPAVRGYRWVVFLLAALYFAEQFTRVSAQGFGWQFRYLTIWALTASLCSAWFMLRQSLGKTDARYDTLASTTMVLNVMVVFLYWRLYLISPSLVNGDGPIVVWREFYLHLLGPVLQWIDALFILNTFRRIKRTALVLPVVILIYVLWSEFLVSPMNDLPAGDVTSGLPYPFLNDLMLPDRLLFYVSTAAVALTVMLICWFLASSIGRVTGRNR